MRRESQLQTADLHDALMHARIVPPQDPSIVAGALRIGKSNAAPATQEDRPRRNAMVAHTGVAANNMGVGALTIDTFFKLAEEYKSEDLASKAADDFVDVVRQARMLVIDEISWRINISRRHP